MKSIREHKFRGKDAFGNWRIGNLLIDNNEQVTIVNYDKFNIENKSIVLPETIGEYVGTFMRHITNIEIFEDDIVLYEDEFCIVKYHDIFNSFVLQQDSGLHGDCFRLYSDTQIELIGNIHDNEDLLDLFKI